jgi:PAS domain S-box-containing protein
MRLRQQLLLLTLAPLAAAIVIVALLVWPQVNRLLAAGVEQEAREQLDIQVQSLDTQLRTLQARLDAIAALPAVRSGTPESNTALLHPLREAFPGADVVNFIDVDGSIRIPGKPSVSVRERYYYPQLQRGEPVVTKAIVSIANNVPEVLILRPVRSLTGEVRGAVGVSLRLSDVLERIKAIQLRSPGFAMLVDDDGRTLSTVPFRGLDATSALFRDAAQKEASPEWRAMLAAMQRRDNDTTTVSLDGQSYRVFYRRMPALGWQLAIGFEEAALFAERDRVATGGAIAFLFVAAFAVGAAMLTRQRVAQPLDALAAAHRAVARGDLSARAPEPPQAELAELARSFNGMADELLANRKRREADEDMLREMFEASPMAIALYRASDRTYLRVNSAYAQLFGMTPAQFAGKTVHEVGLVPDPLRREELRAKLARDGLLQGERLRRTDEAGQVRDYVFSASPVEVGGERLILFTTVDISDTVRLEAQLRQTQKLDLVGRLAGGVAHDFNNMLAGIMAASDLLAMAVQESPTLREEVDVIRDSASRAATLTQQLLMFSRAQPVSRQVFDMHQPVRAALALARRTLDRRIVIVEELTARATTVRGDSALLQTVVMNLLVNARDAMPDGGTLTVSTSLDGGERLRLQVRDTGHGMPTDVAERIFEPFFTTKAPGKGTGLGLSVAFGIVQEHGGEISVRSAPGMGTTVTILLPLVRDENDAPAATSAMVTLTPGRARVLVVDDEPLVRGTIARALLLAGHTVQTAEHGADAVTLVARGERFDVVVLDLVMPGMDGVSTLKALRAHLPEIPAIVCSGYGEDDAFTALSQERHVQLLPKPFGLAELTSLVSIATAAGVR